MVVYIIKDWFGIKDEGIWSNKNRVMALDLRNNFVSGLHLEHLLTNFLQTLNRSSYHI